MFSRRIVVKNPWSKRLVPSEIYDESFIKFAHEAGAYVYLVLVGPQVNIVGLEQQADKWKMRTEFHDGKQMKPRTIPVSFDVLPKDGTTLANGVITVNDGNTESYKVNAIQITRSILDEPVTQASRQERKLTAWEYDTLKKFFTYRVEYIGQAYGKRGSRTAAERIGEGHATVQAVLAETHDHFPNAAVALAVMGVVIGGQEARFTLTQYNVATQAAATTQMISYPDGPLEDEAKLVTTMEAMVIRSFPEARNEQYKEFPLKDAPSLVKDLQAAGITHIGVELDVRGAIALLQHPEGSKEPSPVLRFDVELATGFSGTFPNDSPLTWQIN